MKRLFPALEVRFKSNKRLVSKARKLVQGYEGQKVTGPLPYVEVTCGSSDIATRTFGADIEVYQLFFTIHTGRTQPSLADDIKELMIEVFDDANLLSADFKTVGCVRQSCSGPVLNDAVYDIEMAYEVIVQWNVRRPAVKML